MMFLHQKAHNQQSLIQMDDLKFPLIWGKIVSTYSNSVSLLKCKDIVGPSTIALHFARIDLEGKMTLLNVTIKCGRTSQDECARS